MQLCSAQSSKFGGENSLPADAFRKFFDKKNFPKNLKFRMGTGQLPLALCHDATDTDMLMFYVALYDTSKSVTHCWQHRYDYLEPRCRTDSCSDSRSERLSVVYTAVHIQRCCSHTDSELKKQQHQHYHHHLHLHQ